jgi:hypothetical protein
MIIEKKMSRFCRYALPFTLFALCFCSESDQVIRQKLDIILADDLEAIVEDMPSESLLDEPYYEILEYRKFREGTFRRLAVVDFYFLRGVNMKITRKYRYHVRLGLWDRYYNKYYTFTPETNAGDSANGNND